MGGFSLMHWIVVAVVLVLVLGGGRFSSMMGDVAKGIKQFKKGMAEEEETTTPAAAKPSPRLQTQAPLDPAAERELRPMHDDRPQG